MFKNFIFILFIFLASSLIPQKTEAYSLGDRLSGYILLDVEAHGEAWYVYPNDLKRYYLGRPDDAFKIMRTLGLGATHSFITTQSVFPSYVSGKILLDVETNGEAYYINPQDRTKHYLGRPADAFSIMRQLSLGITTSDLSKISISALTSVPNNTSNDINYEERQIVVNAELYNIKIASVDLLSPNLEIITDTASDINCSNDCPVMPLADYVLNNKGLLAINGSYFCPMEYTSCAATKNYFFYPVYNSRLDKMINDDQLKWPTTGPLMVFDTGNHPYFFASTQTFKDVATFEQLYNTKISAAIANKPALIYNNINIISSAELDDKQRTVKSYRSAIGLKNNKIFLVLASNATVVDLAGIMESLSMEQAMNLDGGDSTALYYQGAYKVGPGRDLPNAIIFKIK
ncbi:MAG TPA: phosphodiester glycosidase family protein [Candidatus Saccharimonadales bacterium]|nr:phosphodiester glycosidase family protein [Candidatus Saccharimonadales bacterium]